MSEGNLPPPKVPTTPQAITGLGQIWSEYFGDEEEMQYMISDIRMRHAAVLMQDGQGYYWLKRMTSGVQCAYWSDDTGTCRAPLDPDSACYNTRYVGGYHQPLLIKVALPSSTRQMIAQDAGLLKVQPMRAWTIHTPEINDRDMLVNSQTGERFEVQNRQVTAPWRGLIMNQFFDLRPMQKGVDYGVEVVIPLLNL